MSVHSPYFQSLSWFGPESIEASPFVVFRKWPFFRRRRLHFNVPRRDPVPHRNVIAGWVRALEETGSTQGLGVWEDQSVRTPENVGAVRAAFEQSPKRSARKHGIALSMSNRSLRRIMHKDIKFHPYNMMIVQELMPPDFQNRVNRAQ